MFDAYKWGQHWLIGNFVIYLKNQLTDQIFENMIWYTKLFHLPCVIYNFIASSNTQKLQT